MMGLPAAQVYVPGLDLTFRWGRGDSCMFVLRGKRAFADEGPIVDQTPVDQRGWVDTPHVYTAVNKYLAAKHAEWVQRHGPVKPPSH